MSDLKDTFADFGDDYQRKVIQALFQDHLFAEQMSDVLEPKFFTPKYLQEISKSFYEYRRKYSSYPSIEILDSIIRTNDNFNNVLKEQTREFLKQVTAKPLNGDARYVQESSLTFCKRQTMGVALGEAIEAVENQDLDAVLSIVRSAMIKGSSRDFGHEYKDGVDIRSQRAFREPISTGLPLLDKEFGGGFDRGTITTFVGGTGSGKSMFLVNCSAASVANGLNVVYVTLELADWKIGQRHDSYYSGIAINDLSENQEVVKKVIAEKVRGQLFIKEYPTKRASVETIRAYLQRLQATKGVKIDMLIVDYPDLLKPLRGFDQKRFELEANYEELRGLAQENDLACLVVDQTNRLGLDVEVVKLEHVSECYNKLMVCDAVVTLARTIDDRRTGNGRIHVAKSRFGSDGAIIPFLMNPATVKVILRDHGDSSDPVGDFKKENENLMELAATGYDKFKKKIKKDQN